MDVYLVCAAWCAFIYSSLSFPLSLSSSLVRFALFARTFFHVPVPLVSMLNKPFPSSFLQNWQRVLKKQNGEQENAKVGFLLPLAALHLLPLCRATLFSSLLSGEGKKKKGFEILSDIGRFGGRASGVSFFHGPKKTRPPRKRKEVWRARRSLK